MIILVQRIEESGIAHAFPDTTFASFYCSSHVNGITCMLTINRKIGTLLPLENLQHLLTRSLFFPLTQLRESQSVTRLVLFAYPKNPVWTEGSSC